MERIKIRRLLKNIPVQSVKGSKEVEITGLSSNSKWVMPGDLFIAKKGMTHDGTRFISDAINAGASAILTDLYDPFYPNIVQIIHPDVAKIEALIAKEFYGHPSDRLFLVGVTGTNGKTTTSYLIRHLLEKENKEGIAKLHRNKKPIVLSSLKREGKSFPNGDDEERFCTQKSVSIPSKRCGLIGTIEWIVGDHVLPSKNTTPDVLTNYKLFSEMRAQGCESCVMEVSSHALDQERVSSIEFDVAVFTNLTQDHLDYHKTMEDYAQAKAKLFSSLKTVSKPSIKTAVINADSPYCEEMIAKCSVPVLRYGIDRPSDLSALNICLSASGMHFDITYQNKKYRLFSPLIGRFNVYNLLAATAVALISGLTMEEILLSLSDFGAVPGRLERIPNGKGLNIFVDYAHTDDALFNVLNTLKELKKGRLITVFGCGGNRDVTKRPKMGAVVESLSDLAIITSDNPRKEDPEEIIRQILAGLQNPKNAQVLIDREEAIHRAIHLATPEDIVLIAGKGHETEQIFAQQIINFDDRIVATRFCKGLL